MAKIKAFLQTGTARVLIELIAVSALALFGYAAAVAAMSSGLLSQQTSKQPNQKANLSHGN